uniref:Uncharacterized protein n=1 Tax=Amphimedon queenslandica TaxID=400682 RepID=A0A1X7UWX5_AMPQE
MYQKIHLKIGWKSVILKHGGHVTDGFDMSSLAKVSDGYTPGHMITGITQVLTERRIQQGLSSLLVGGSSSQ